MKSTMLLLERFETWLSTPGIQDENCEGIAATSNDNETVDVHVSGTPANRKLVILEFVHFSHNFYNSFQAPLPRQVIGYP